MGCPARTWPKGVKGVGVAEMGEARPENEKGWPVKWAGWGVLLWKSEEDYES